MCSVVVIESSDLDVGISSVETDKHGSDLYKPQVNLVNLVYAMLFSMFEILSK
jgi:hypothetical protein